MRTVTILEASEHNFNMIFIYHDKRLSAMNYVLMSETISELDFENNQELLQIYLDKAMVNDFDQYRIGCDAVLEYMDRDNIRTAIKDMTDEMIEKMFTDERVGIDMNGIVLNQKEIDIVRGLEEKIMQTMDAIFKAREYKVDILKHSIKNEE